ncbi:Uncharacterized conserved protein, DUF2164 family [Dethiosulfatibacter aminovorans DSM 17477]|uniref:Uncharacterized conserved protein, DUF2164 family n=1 Tax=Dethiosulfatibacter aminovorans DSM 17477 TaxID=1121476 RepID=A0A1M6FVJ8_9FIRM|nr:DUF2164 family protein [Dethiosulfatibacter aminovorans]SHJ01708.1 Uncharacterized conserved protein, DUF2164 family [Dethiosulfatibacter aminovorans DSM 17477]
MKKDMLSEMQKNEIMKLIMGYMDEELDVDMGNMQAMLMLDFILKEIGPYIYKAGVDDAARFIGDKLEDLYELTI